MRASRLTLKIFFCGALATVLIAAVAGRRDRWTAEEREALRSLSLASLGPLPDDPSNRFAKDAHAAALGEKLFADTRLSGNGKVSCATCHLPQKDFQDGTPLAHGVGTTGRRTMPVAGTAYGAWFFWDGRTDSQWSQALGPLESAVEHGGTRTQYAHTIAAHYREEYQQVFGALPDLDGLPAQAGPVADTAWRAAWTRIPAARQGEITKVYANIGKAIAAFERRIGFAPTRFDRYVEAELGGRTHDSTSSLSDDEIAGLKLFVGKANCVNCHNGARLTDDHFHNTGVPASSLVSAVDSGRAVGVRQALAAEFACTSKYSDAKADDCAERVLRAAHGIAPDQAIATALQRRDETRRASLCLHQAESRRRTQAARRAWRGERGRRDLLRPVRGRTTNRRLRA